MVEFAFVAILLLTLLFGIMEAAWGFFNLLDARHASNEGARLAAVDIDPVADTCAALSNNFSGTTTVEVTFADDNGSGSADIGDSITVEVVATNQSLTNFIDVFNNITFTQDESYRIEQNPSAGGVAPLIGAGAQTCP